MLLEPEAASAVGFDHGMQDWRSVLPRITIPTLSMGGEASMVPVATVKQVSDSIPNATLRVLTAVERGSHLSFLENPDLVNKIRNFFAMLPATSSNPRTLS
jgi:pimeloyl-ACP methyl ester carboxylesterase